MGTADTLTMGDMARLLRDAFPGYAKKIPKATLPQFVVRILALFDRTLRTVVPDLGVTPTASSEYVTQLTGVTFRPAEEAVRAAGQSLIAHGVV